MTEMTATEISDFRSKLHKSLHQSLFDYWLSKRPGPGKFPDRTAIDPLDIPKLLPWIFLIDVEQLPDGKQFKVRLVGTELANKYNRDNTGLIWGEFDRDIHVQYVDQVTESYTGVIETRRPFIGTLNMPFEGRDYISCTRLILPLENDLGEIYMLFCMNQFD